jgi:hypothetical protein
MEILQTPLATCEHSGADLLNRLKAAYPTVQEAGGDLAELALAVGIQHAQLHALLEGSPQLVAELDATHRIAEIEGRLLKPAAQRLVLGMLRYAQKALDAGQLDVDDVANLLTKAHRVIEHADNVEQKAGGGNLPIVNIVIGLGGIRAEVVQPSPVVEVAPDSRECDDLGSPPARAEVFPRADGSIDFAALLGAEDANAGEVR